MSPTPPGPPPATPPATPQATSGPAPATGRRALLLLPLGVAVAAGAGFWAMLARMSDGRFDPHAIGDPLLGRPLPDFTLETFTGGSPPASAPFSAADVRRAASARPLVLNFFASWCVPCAIEAPALAELARSGQPIWGIAYEDDPGRAAAFLDRTGNPYERIATDPKGRAAIEFGLYGVPETYLIDRAGIVRWHLAGPLDATSAQALQRSVKAAT